MASCQELDAACSACVAVRARRLILALIALLALLATAVPSRAQENPSDSPQLSSARLSSAQRAFDSGKWDEAERLARGPADQPAALDLLAGLALAKLQRWDEARAAFEAGCAKSPGDARFPIELAGVAYKQHNFGAAKRELRVALRLDPRDAYTREFLGTLYFLEGNLEATLKYWNKIDKPRLRNVSVQPPPQVDAELLQRTIGFNAPQVLTRDALLGAEARLDNLGLYPRQRIELTPAGTGNYDATLHLPERNGWGDSRWEGALSLLSGLAYDTVYPEFYDLGHRAVNVTSLLRWDAQKRRAYAELYTPLLDDPRLRFRFYFDARNENWNLASTFFRSGAVLGDLNMRRIAGGLELRTVMNGQWSLSTGLEIASRTFRNLAGHTSASEAPFFSDGQSLAYWARVDRSLWRVPEQRFTVDSWAEARIGREFVDRVGSFATVRGSLTSRWLPQGKGDDYETQAQIRGGETFGQVPFDELFQLGVERDNDLWLRGHAGTSGGRKGAAPLGRRYFLANWEIDKNVYGNGLFTVQLGPFVDTGAIKDSSGLFGSQRWLVDTGAQCKIRVLGSLTVVLSYGRDVRGGRNAWFGTVVR
jgi:tetratricopeptide (TPR) repeat protein